MKALVVGAGLAGLAAAVALVDGGADVTVVDPDGPGGKARTRLPRPDWRIEAGPHSFTHRAEPLFAFADRLGVADRIVRVGEVARARFLVRGGRLRRASPFGGALSVAELWALARGVFRRSSPEGTVRDWMARTFGAAVADGAGGVGTVGIWAAGPEEVELAAGFPALAEGLRAHGSLFRMLRAASRTARAAGTYGFREGMGTLVGAAAAAVGGVQPVRVGGITPAGDGWRVDGVGVFDTVTVATEAPAAARLTAAWPEAARALAEVRYSPILAAHWLAADAAFPHGFGYLVPPAEGRRVLGTLFTSDLHPGWEPAGTRSFTTLLGGTKRPRDVDLDAQAVGDLLDQEHRALTGRALRIDALELSRHSAAVAIPGPGHVARVARIHAALPSTLALAGSWCGGGAMPDAIRAGGAAAARLLAAREGVHRVA